MAKEQGYVPQLLSFINKSGDVCSPELRKWKFPSDVLIPRFLVLELYPILVPHESVLPFPPWFFFSDDVMGTCTRLSLTTYRLLPATPCVGAVPAFVVQPVFTAQDPQQACPSWYRSLSTPVSGYD